MCDDFDTGDSGSSDISDVESSSDNNDTPEQITQKDIRDKIRDDEDNLVELWDGAHAGLSKDRPKYITSIEVVETPVGSDGSSEDYVRYHTSWDTHADERVRGNVWTRGPSRNTRWRTDFCTARDMERNSYHYSNLQGDRWQPEPKKPIRLNPWYYIGKIKVRTAKNFLLAITCGGIGTYLYSLTTINTIELLEGMAVGAVIGSLVFILGRNKNE